MLFSAAWIEHNIHYNVIFSAKNQEEAEIIAWRAYGENVKVEPVEMVE
jgi:hypothetical protein